jgi:drug/metabolite transporter (DMT)-like permease
MWYGYALLGPAIWALLNHLDKYLLARFFKGGATASVLVVFTGCAGSLVATAILLFGPSMRMPVPWQAAVLMGAGALLVSSCMPYMIAMQRNEASVVASLYRLTPLFVFALSNVVLGESLRPRQIIGGLVTIAGSISLIVDLDKKRQCRLDICTGLMAPLALVSILTGLHPFFLLAYGVVFTTLFPTFSRERLTRHHLLQKVVAISVMCAGIVVTFTD